MKRSAKTKAAKRAANTKTAQQSRVVTPTANAPKVDKTTVAKGQAATGPKPPVDWAAAGRKAWETRQRNATSGAPKITTNTKVTPRQPRIPTAPAPAASIDTAVIAGAATDSAATA